MTEDVEDQPTEATSHWTRSPRSYRSTAAGDAAHQISALASQPRSFLSLSRNSDCTVRLKLRSETPPHFRKIHRKIWIIYHCNESSFSTVRSFYSTPSTFSLSFFLGVQHKLNCNGGGSSNHEDIAQLKRRSALNF